jgi:predicted nucleic acid-binding protein
VATAPTILLDTGPWVALHCRGERHHAWAVEQFASRAPPFLTCEAVVTETCFLLARAGFDPAKALALVERGVVRVAMTLSAEIGAVRSLFERYDNVPASLADACLIRLSELYDSCRVLTLDSDFHVYRRHGRKVIALLRPD